MIACTNTMVKVCGRLLFLIGILSREDRAWIVVDYYNTKVQALSPSTCEMLELF